MNKKIYFAGSIRGGRVDAELYRRIIAYINRTDTVLTEHVGDLSLSVLEGSASAEATIYDQDTAWLRECDLLVAECTCPSLGVGYELAYAEKLGKPCHVFYDRGKTQLSAMLTGDPYFVIHPYTNEDEIYPILDGILK
ncbi:MAG: nucleoside 2-deoxyribosyltransferase [Clostridia bacterium]|nr:nucleoside 2-deoxyribosyltransferase [Clostridia bacterium]